ncbi:expressed protein, partial [Aureococcus anophagefferens]
VNIKEASLLSVEATNLEGEVETRISDQIAAGATYDQNSAQFAPKALFTRWTAKGSDPLEVTGTFNIADQSAEVDVKYEKLGSKFGVNFNSARSSLITAARTSRDFSVEGRTINVAPSYNFVTGVSSALTSDTSVELALDSADVADRDALQSVVCIDHSFNGKNSIKHTFALNSGVSTYEYKRKLGGDAALSVAAHPGKSVEIEWDEVGTTGLWTTNVRLPWGKPDRAQVSLAMDFAVLMGLDSRFIVKPSCWQGVLRFMSLVEAYDEIVDRFVHYNFAPKDVVLRMLRCSPSYTCGIHIIQQNRVFVLKRMRMVADLLADRVEYLEIRLLDPTSGVFDGRNYKYTKSDIEIWRSSSPSEKVELTKLGGLFDFATVAFNSVTGLDLPSLRSPTQGGKFYGPALALTTNAVDDAFFSEITSRINKGKVYVTGADTIAGGVELRFATSLERNQKGVDVSDLDLACANGAFAIDSWARGAPPRHTSAAELGASAAAFASDARAAFARGLPPAPAHLDPMLANVAGALAAFVPAIVLETQALAAELGVEFPTRERQPGLWVDRERLERRREDARRERERLERLERRREDARRERARLAREVRERERDERLERAELKWRVREHERDERARPERDKRARLERDKRARLEREWDEQLELDPVARLQRFLRLDGVGLPPTIVCEISRVGRPPPGARRPFTDTSNAARGEEPAPKRRNSPMVARWRLYAPKRPGRDVVVFMMDHAVLVIRPISMATPAARGGRTSTARRARIIFSASRTRSTRSCTGMALIAASTLGSVMSLRWTNLTVGSCMCLVRCVARCCGRCLDGCRKACCPAEEEEEDDDDGEAEEEAQNLVVRLRYGGRTLVVAFPEAEAPSARRVFEAECADPAVDSDPFWNALLARGAEADADADAALARQEEGLAKDWEAARGKWLTTRSVARTADDELRAAKAAAVAQGEAALEAQLGKAPQATPPHVGRMDLAALRVLVDSDELESDETTQWVQARDAARRARADAARGEAPAGEPLDDKAAALEAVKRDGLALARASEDLRADADVVAAAVAQNGLALAHASEALRATKDVVLAAVKRDGMAIHAASLELQADYDVILAGVDGLRSENT